MTQRPRTSPREKREAELDRALERLHFAFRAVTEGPDRLLEKRGLSRVHHRILYFVARNPGLSVSDLLTLLGVSKQALHGPLRQLMTRGLLRRTADVEDRRIKRLTLSEDGTAFEAALSGQQRERFARVFRQVGQRGEATWHEVMRRLSDEPPA